MADEGAAKGVGTATVLREAEAAPSVVLEACGLAKAYGSRRLFRGIHFRLETGQSLVVTGPNGSGKSTLLRILCGLTRPTEGSVAYRVMGRRPTEQERRNLIGLVAPDLVLYDELTALENLRFFARVRGLLHSDEALEQLLAQVGLGGRGHDLVGTYSSGMVQRLRYAFALLHKPPILLLDEPTANLDESGIAFAHTCMAHARKRGILIVATNDPEEQQFGDYLLRLGGGGVGSPS